jgi:hypothetical protein
VASRGIKIDRSTLAGWIGYAAAELAPLARRLREILLGSAKIAVDETPAPVLDRGRRRTKTGYFWAIARDDRTWGGSDPTDVGLSAGRRGDSAMARTYREIAIEEMLRTVEEAMSRVIDCDLHP